MNSMMVQITGKPLSKEQLATIDRVAIHKQAASELPPGARYEIRQSPPRNADALGTEVIVERGWCHDEDMASESEWAVGALEPPEAKDGYLLCGRYIVSLCRLGACFGGRIRVGGVWHPCQHCEAKLKYPDRHIELSI